MKLFVVAVLVVWASLIQTYTCEDFKRKTTKRIVPIDIEDGIAGIRNHGGIGNFGLIGKQKRIFKWPINHHSSLSGGPEKDSQYWPPGLTGAT
jgi:hypothetical protein